MEEKATPPPPPLPLKVTPDEVSGRCTVMGPAAARVGEPCEGWSGYGREAAESVRAHKNQETFAETHGLCAHVCSSQEDTESCWDKKSEHGGKKCPKECVVGVCSLALWLALPHPAAPNSCSLIKVSLFWFGTFVLL